MEINELPSSFKKWAVENRSAHNRKFHRNYLGNNINWAFTWVETPQGGCFWHLLDTCSNIDNKSLVNYLQENCILLNLNIKNNKMATKAKTASSEVTIFNEEDSVLGVLSTLKEELKGLRIITETAYKTGGVVDGFPIKIQDETKIDNLIRMQASVSGRQKAYNEAQDELSTALGGNLSVPVFKVSGNTPVDLKADIVLRIQVLSVEERKNKLENLIKKSEKFLSEKDQFALFKKEVASFINKGSE